MTPETLEKVSQINKEISKLKSFREELNGGKYLIDLRFIKQEKGKSTDRIIFGDIESLKDIFDKHKAMIRKELSERIKRLSKAMLREREIDAAASKYVEDNSVGGAVRISDHRDSFIEGAEWADTYPMTPWISVEDDLPCNHEEMYHMSESLICTDRVLTLVDNVPVIMCMVFNEKTGGWDWSKPLNVRYWMRIPKLEEE